MTIKIDQMLLKGEKKVSSSSRHQDMSRTAAIILGGGQGTRLFPLTMHCSKPAVKLGGKYKLIDIPISNALNSGCHKIFVLTQFFSSSLHRHIFLTHRHLHGSVELLTAEQKHKKQAWFQGTADAVRQNLEYLYEVPADYFLILSGDQLYNMDYADMMQKALDTDADVVLAALPIEESECHRMGILKIDDSGKIVDFIEKPSHLHLLQKMKMNAAHHKSIPSLCKKRRYLASMGIYLFKREVLFDLLAADPRDDFGKHLLPEIIKKGHAVASLFDGYWEDIGTIEAFYRANMGLLQPNPQFNCYNEQKPIYGVHFQLPAAQIEGALVANSIICEGSIVKGKEVINSILGPRSVIGEGSRISHSYIMGNDFYAPPVQTSTLPKELKIGQNCIINKAIIDKNVHIGNNVQLTNVQNLTNYDHENIYIRDGIIVVPRGASIPDGFIL